MRKSLTPTPLTLISFNNSFAEIEDYLHQVAGNHTDSVRLTEEGRTLEGRPIYLVRIGTHPASSPAIFIDAGT